MSTFEFLAPQNGKVETTNSRKRYQPPQLRKDAMLAKLTAEDSKVSGLG